jgi:hypothetical protein
MSPKIYRQGDVLLELLPSLPPSARPVTTNGLLILAHGEATGHHHSIRSSTARLYREEESDGVSYVEIAEALALLEHQEHAAIPLPRGCYRVIRQREYTPKGVPKSVVD